VKNFSLTQPTDAAVATVAATHPGTSFIAGGTTVIDLWKLGAYEFDSLVDIQKLELRGIQAYQGTLHLGALETMNAVGEQAGVQASFPVVSQSLLLAASPQIRNMGTMGGNLLQRPRSVTYRNPNPRRQDGESRFDAIFGVTPFSRAPHPSDLAVALTALDATLRIQNSAGAERVLKLSAFYQLPGSDLRFDTLGPGDLITAVEVQVPFAHRSAYIKIRDRASYQFAVVSAAAVLDLDGGTIREARLAAGGVGTIPWRLPKIEAALKGKPATQASYEQALTGIGEGATTHVFNKFKVPLLRQTALRALLAAGALA
jgi:xanthine dehydrogenase YagS FAD-binding subunit